MSCPFFVSSSHPKANHMMIWLFGLLLIFASISSVQTSSSHHYSSGYQRKMVRGGRHLHDKTDRPVAAVYRGPLACDGCAESVAELMKKSHAHFKVHYLGPNETHDVTPQTLSHLDIFAWPGGGDDVDSDYKTVTNYTAPIQSYVRGGGRYAGFCMGAFLARGQGHKETFFGLLPDGSYVDSEVDQKGSQVKGTNDTVILTDWTFHTGPEKGKTEKKRWQYFQDGGFIHLAKDAIEKSTVLGRYTYTQHPCATVTQYGKGHVGLVGVHPEADSTWYDLGFKNPQGIHHDIGHDFIMTLFEAKA